MIQSKYSSLPRLLLGVRASKPAARRPACERATPSHAKRVVCVCVCVCVCKCVCVSIPPTNGTPLFRKKRLGEPVTAPARPCQEVRAGARARARSQVQPMIDGPKPRRPGVPGLDPGQGES